MPHNNAADNLFLNQKVVQVTADYTVLANDMIIEVGALSAPITITLPMPSSENKGKYFLIKDGLGIAQIHTISITAPSSTQADSSLYTLAQNYGSIEFYSTGTTYRFYLNTTPLARGVWVKNKLEDFNAGVVQTNSLVTNWNTTPAPPTARLDLSTLTNISLINLTVAADGKSITFSKPGLYSIALSSTIDGDVYGLLQLIGNTQTVFQVCLNYPIKHAQIKPLQIVYLAHFVVGDTLDFRYAVYRSTTSYQFVNITLLIQQLA